MNALSWNCRGLGNSRAIRALGDLIKSHKPNILFLIETLSVEDRIKKLCVKFGFKSYWVVDSVGRSGGLAMLWDSSVQCSVVGADKNYIDLHLLSNNTPLWRLTGFNGFPERSHRRESWDLLDSLSKKSSLPWCVIGDFNDMLNEEDKSGSHKHPQALLEGFRRTIEECGLIELELMGGKYTWEKSRGKPEWVRERIDRAFGSTSWWQKFPLSKLMVHHTIYSDHDPVHLELYSTSHSRKKFRFRFENTWLKEENFYDEVSCFWRSLNPVQFLPKLLELSGFMEKWGRKFFNKFREKIRKQKEILELFEGCRNEFEVNRYFEEKSKLEDLLVHEEEYWKQRAKSFWLLDGDSNTKYFHTYATTRKKRSNLTQLRDENDDIVTDHEGMSRVVKMYFEKLFGQENNDQDNSMSQARGRVYI